MKFNTTEGTFNQTQINEYVKDLAKISKEMVDVMCFAEELKNDAITAAFTRVDNGKNDAVRIEIAKKYAKYANDQMSVDLDIGEVQTMQNVINDIVNICEENNWFEKGNK